MNKSETLFEIANEIALSTSQFFEKKGAGPGNNATNIYIKAVGARAKEVFGEDYSEKFLSGENSLAVDFYFPDEATIVEVALGLKNPNTEYEKDILKAIMAKNLGYKVEKLFFISKPGGTKKCSQPGRIAMKNWLENNIGISLEVKDLG
jgi:hypothetical protein